MMMVRWLKTHVIGAPLPGERLRLLVGPDNRRVDVAVGSICAAPETVVRYPACEIDITSCMLLSCHRLRRYVSRPRRSVTRVSAARFRLLRRRSAGRGRGVLCASMAAIIGKPVPTKTERQSSRRRGHTRQQLGGEVGCHVTDSLFGLGVLSTWALRKCPAPNPTTQPKLLYLLR